MAASQSLEHRVGATQIAAAYRRTLARRTAIVAALALACLCGFALDLITGPSSMTAGQVLRGLL